MPPADIDIHMKVDLQDAEVTKEQQEAFKELCSEYKDILPADSSDIGKTPIIEMEIDTDDSPTSHPKTLHSSFRTCYLGTERVRDFAESWSNSKKCLSLG